MSNKLKYFKNKWAAHPSKVFIIVVLIGSMLPWVNFPLTGLFNSYSVPFFKGLSWGVVIFALVCVSIFKSRKLASFVLLVLILSFPIKLFFDYGFFQEVALEGHQKELISEFAHQRIYEPNIVNSPIKASSLEIDQLSHNYKSFLFLLGTLGIGYWFTLFGVATGFRKIGLRKISLVLLTVFIFCLPDLVTASLVSLGRASIIDGRYENALGYLRSAYAVNKYAGNNTLKGFETYYYWVGESKYNLGYYDAVESQFFLGKRFEREGAYLKAKGMYRSYASVPGAEAALVRVLVKEAVRDIEDHKYGSSIARLREALDLDPHDIEALFYITYAAFIIEDNELGFYYSDRLIAECSEGFLVSDEYNIMGEAYQKAGAFDSSRRMFRKSIEAFDKVKKGNYRAWEAIAGW